jgi:zinc protease
VETGGKVVSAQRLSVPVAGPPRPLRVPKIAERQLRSGLRVIVVRKPAVPKVEIQLMVPLGQRTVSGAAERVLPKTLTSGTSKRSSVEIAIEQQRMGSWIASSVSSDHFALNGSVLAPYLKRYLGLVGELLTDAAFPANEISLERDRTVQEIQISRSQPQVVALEAMRRRLFGRHPYGLVFPEPAAVAKVGRAALKRIYDGAIGPRGAIMILVGDVPPQRALDDVESALAGWRGRTRKAELPDPPPIRPGPTVIVDRPGAVQTNIRIAGDGLPVGHPDSYALQVANTIFGGAFMSRLIQNLREDKGYTYSPHSSLPNLKHKSLFEISADVGTEVTAASLVETRYELGRMAALDVEKEELEGAQRYLSGIQAIRIQSQRGLAGSLAGLVVYGLDVGYLKDYARRIAAVTVADVHEVGLRFFAPSRLVTLLVGDAGRIAKDVEALEPVKVETAS